MKPNTRKNEPIRASLRLVVPRHGTGGGRQRDGWCTRRPAGPSLGPDRIGPSAYHRAMLAARVCLPALVVLLASCDGGGLPAHWGGPRTGSGPRVVWDLTARPLPEIPLPNDVATFPDPGSPTGRRINASLVAPTGVESRLRAHF